VTWHSTPENIAILARYAHKKGYDLLDLAVMSAHGEAMNAFFAQAQKWHAHEQEKQETFNEDAKRVQVAS
jgi:aminoglycoside phosphotransferase (APT) family kinase protein